MPADPIAEFFRTSPFARHEDVVRTPYEAVFENMSDPENIKDFKEMFSEIFKQTVYRSGITYNGPPIRKINARELMVAYTCASFPRETFDQMGINETRLQTQALDMITRLGDLGKHWLDHQNLDTVSPDTCTEFLKSVHKYLDAFLAWQVPDQAAVVQKVKDAVRELVRYIMTSTETTPAAYVQEAHTSLTRMMEKLTQLTTPMDRAAFIQELTQAGLTNPDVIVAQAAATV